MDRLDGFRAVGRFEAALTALHDPDRFPQWVPTLPVLSRHLLNRGHPFWKEGDRALFLARRGGRVVGRVAAIENRAHNRRHGDRVGFFGFFDVADDAEAAAALVDAAREWLAGRGLTAIRGPVSPSLNYVSGCLVEGFDRPNTFLTPWNPPWYGPHLERAGLAPVRTLAAFWITMDLRLPERLERAAEVARQRGDITFREADPDDYGEQGELLRTLYNEAWADTWGFVPFGPDEFAGLAAAGQHLVRQDWGFFAEARGETVGFVLAVPDYNRVLQGPRWRRWAAVALPRMLLARRRIPAGRVMLLGLREGYRGARLLPLFLHELLHRGRTGEVEGAEASWVLEGGLMYQALAGIGAELSRRWQILEDDIRVTDA